MFELGDEGYCSDYDISHEELYLELERLKAENYGLRRQLRNKSISVRNLKKTIRAMNKKLKSVNSNKEHYRNGRKRGSRGFNG